jgi:lactoylglutathione lyase
MLKQHCGGKIGSTTSQVLTIWFQRGKSSASFTEIARKETLSHCAAVASQCNFGQFKARNTEKTGGLIRFRRRLTPTLQERLMKYLHTMIRVADLDASLDFFVNKLGFVEQRRHVSDKGRFTLVFVACPESPDAPVELTYNWDPEVYTGGRNFGHLAYQVDNIYEYCEKLMKHGITINRPPREGRMAFIKTPDGISIEILQKGEALPLAEPWTSMPNIGTW